MSGGRNIERVLEAIPRRYQRKALVHAFRSGAKIVQKESQRLATQKIDITFAKSITVSRPSGRNRPSKNTIVTITLKKPSSRLAHLFEFGTAQRFQKSGRFTGRITARPFLRPALDAKGDEAIREIARLTKENIEITVRQLSRGRKVSLAKKNRVF